MQVLTIEEQREVALKVVFGICSLIAAGLFLSYCYHKMTEESVKPPRVRHTRETEETLVGDIEEIDPWS